MSNVRMVVILVVVILVLVLAGRALGYTNEPSFCQRCHIIEPFYESWKMADHAKWGVECIDCHFESGAIGYLKGKTYSVLKLAEFAIGAYGRPTRARLVSNQNCLKCHETVLAKRIDLSGGLQFYHEKHVDRAKAECRQCHTAIGHPGAVAMPVVTQPPRISMDSCLICHDGTHGPVIFGEAMRSGVLHPGEPQIDTELWKQTHWRAALGTLKIQGQSFKIDKAACMQCHEEPTTTSPCQNCHLPALASFPSSVENCLRCHSDILDEKLDLDGVPYYHERHLHHVDLICQDCHIRITHQDICANCHNGKTAPAIFGRLEWRRHG
ncbi:MAG: NapC/NirT family cytochrome c [Anaerolineae bacterium]